MSKRIKWDRTEIFIIIFDKKNGKLFGDRVGVTRLNEDDGHYAPKLTLGKRRTFYLNFGKIQIGKCICSVKRNFVDKKFSKVDGAKDKVIIETNIVESIEHIGGNDFRVKTSSGAILQVCILSPEITKKEFDSDGKEIKIKVITKVVTK